MSKNIFKTRKKINQDNLQLDEEKKMDESQKEINNEIDYYLINSLESAKHKTKNKKTKYRFNKLKNNNRINDLRNIKNKKCSKSSFKLIFSFISLFFFIGLLILAFKLIRIKKRKINNNINFNENIKEKYGNFEISEDYPEEYERYIFDRIKNRIKGPLLMGAHEYYFINGLVRKYKPKKLLEIGVCSGAVSATLINAIMDVKDAFLYSCDLETKHYTSPGNEVGVVVKKNFPEFLSKWKLYTGNTTAAFIEEIGPGIDFVFLDTSHVMPGEVLNIIEILPFLSEGAIIAMDDINHQSLPHLAALNNFYPSNNLLMSVLKGKKIMISQKKEDNFSFKKLGAVLLEPNQQNYAFDYFYLLTNLWSYMPNRFEIETIRELIRKYYKPYFLSMFDNAFKLNYDTLKKKGLLQKDYMGYTFTNFDNRKKPDAYA